MPKVIFIAPAHNEAENIEAFIDEWMPAVESTGPESRLLIIDDGSRDETLQLVQNKISMHSCLDVITRTNAGHGATLHFGYETALLERPDYIFQLDSDRQTTPEEFRFLWELKDEKPMIIGHRLNRQDGFSRRLVALALSFILWIIFRVWIPDANTPFRLMGRDELERAMKVLPPGHNLTNVLLTVFFMKKSTGACWVPITFKPRQAGANSLNLLRILTLGSAALTDFVRFSRKLRHD